MGVNDAPKEAFILELKNEKTGKVMFGYTNCAGIHIDGKLAAVSATACAALNSFIQQLMGSTPKKECKCKKI